MITVRRPKTGRIGSEHFVDKNNFVAFDAEFKFGVRDDDAFFLCDLPRPAVDCDGSMSHLLGSYSADFANHFFERDVHVVGTYRRFCGRSEDGLFQT